MERYTPDKEKLRLCGGLVMAGINGTTLDSGALELISTYGINNFIIFSRNAEAGPAQLERLCSDLKTACRQAGLPPALIAVDQEGGTVQRLGPPWWPPLPSALEAGSNGIEAVKRLAVDTAAMLAGMGIGMNMAPVLDIAGNRVQRVLEKRCFGHSGQAVAAAGKTYIDTLQACGIAAVAKHFPGIGLVQDDPHIKRPVVTASSRDMEQALHPFKRAFNAGVSSVMTSHVIFTALDRTLPASFSSIVARELLRKQLGFSGMLITDDLEMGGITEHGSVPDAALEAFMAGHDMLLVCHTHALICATVKKLAKALENGKIGHERLTQSLKRIRKIRDNYCKT